VRALLAARLLGDDARSDRIYFFATLAMISAVLVVSAATWYRARFSHHCAAGDGGNFFAAARGIFVHRAGDFVCGRIMVLFVFVIMLINLDVSLHQCSQPAMVLGWCWRWCSARN